jgi:preprotein translocase subunit SecD/SecD/SecF fusion protein
MNPKQLNYLLLALCVVLVAGGIALVFWPRPANSPSITQALDIRGGLSVTLKAQPTAGQTLTAGDMEKAQLIINNRVNKLGASETSVQRQGSDSLLVQIPGIKNADEALKIINTTGKLEFVDVSSLPSATVAAINAWSGGDGSRATAPSIPETVTYTPVLGGDVIRTANAGQSSGVNAGQITVNLTMNEAGAKAWSDYTTTHKGQQVAIVLDREVQSAPVVQDAIVTGDTEISGNFTVEEAKYLSTVLQTGSLPVKLEPADTRQVGATLGQDSLRQGVIAALVGLFMVAIYLLVFYRGIGLIAVVGLGVFGSLFLGLLAVLSQFGVFALSLPGVAGIVLTIGLAADSSILINERFREEIGMGKTVRSAANSGSKHAIITSADADIVTFVSAMALFLLAIGPVKGFAFTLMLGIAVDLLIMFIFNRPLLMLLAENVIPKAPAFWGVPKVAVPQRAAASKKGGATNA